MHFFTAASGILGPPSIFIVKSPKSDANVYVNWTRLLDRHMYGGIKVEPSDEIYGLTYLSVVVFSDPDGYSDLWTASKSNKTYQEYYLSQLEYSLVRADPVPDPSTGLIHLVYRSDPRRRHKLLSNGGLIEVTISCKDTLQDLKAGIAFKSEISFHNLTIPHPTSKLGVGVVLFSNLSLTPSGDFQDAKSIISLPGKPNVPYQISSARLESEEEGLPLHSMPHEILLKSPSDRRRALTPVLFRPSPVGNLGGEGKVVPVTVLAGPRYPLRGSNQRRRLTRSIGKALYGEEFEQNFQKTKKGPLKKYPVGMRLQHFAFSARGQQAAAHISW
ncbi:unnamed protein product [Mesocestoides corti]|uniref:Uncharacterized protein n=1 Tax=Mesocestoides corti TaxID=53468 RepID=A0A0R3UJT1_MESCO|nr:unnamed protein product [Mesocestoides corti]